MKRAPSHRIRAACRAPFRGRAAEEAPETEKAEPYVVQQSARTEGSESLPSDSRPQSGKQLSRNLLGNIVIYNASEFLITAANCILTLPDTSGRALPRPCEDEPCPKHVHAAVPCSAAR